MNPEAYNFGERLRGVIRKRRYSCLTSSGIARIFFYIVVVSVLIWGRDLGLSLDPTGPAENVGLAQAAPLQGYRSAVNPEPAAIEAYTQPRFAVQVGAYENRVRAELLAQLLSAQHKDIQVAPRAVAGTVLYRIRIPVETEAGAKTLAANLRRGFEIETWVVSLP